MSQAAVAQRYARAIFELGLESGEVAAMVAPITRFAEAYAQNAELRSVLDNPLVEQAQRDAILADVSAHVGLDGTALNAVRLLASRHKLSVLPDVAKLLARLSDQHAGVVRASVTSAVPLPESFYRRLQGELEVATSRRVVLERLHDPSLIAGVITRIGDNTIDGSIKGRLAEMERQLRIA